MQLIRGINTGPNLTLYSLSKFCLQILVIFFLKNYLYNIIEEWYTLRKKCFILGGSFWYFCNTNFKFIPSIELNSKAIGTIMFATSATVKAGLISYSLFVQIYIMLLGITLLVLKSYIVYSQVYLLYIPITLTDTLINFTILSWLRVCIYIKLWLLRCLLKLLQLRFFKLIYNMNDIHTNFDQN